jgi:hypothetical protein
MVSMVMDDYLKRSPLQPQYYPNTGDFYPSMMRPNRAEFDALKREVEELKKVLVAATAYDEATGQPDCENSEKIALLKKIADLVGVDLSELSAPSSTKGGGQA